MLPALTYSYAAVLPSCLGVVERHSGKCGNITEFEGDEARCGQTETTEGQLAITSVT